MKEDIDKNVLTSYLVGEEGVKVNLLQYVDDTIFIREVYFSNVVAIKCMLRCFELVFGFKVNFFKNNYGIISGDSGLIERYANFLNCKLLSLPFVYLGVPIVANRRLESTRKP